MKTETKARPLVMMSRSVFMVERGLKTQTRRVINPQPEVKADWWKDWRQEDGSFWRLYDDLGNSLPSYPTAQCDYGVVGDRIWLKEKWRVIRAEATQEGFRPSKLLVGYGDKEEEWRSAPLEAILKYVHDGRWKSGRFMPRWASRRTVAITEISIDRLQDITKEDVRAEGVPETWGEWQGMGPDDVEPRDWDAMDWRKQWATVWDMLHGKEGKGWDTNPWIFKIAFKRVKEAA